MNEEIRFTVNDTTREIEKVLLGLRIWYQSSDMCRHHETEVLMQKLEEARLLSLIIIRVKTDERIWPLRPEHYGR